MEIVIGILFVFCIIGFLSKLAGDGKKGSGGLTEDEKFDFFNKKK